MSLWTRQSDLPNFAQFSQVMKPSRRFPDSKTWLENIIQKKPKNGKKKQKYFEANFSKVHWALRAGEEKHANLNREKDRMAKKCTFSVINSWKRTPILPWNYTKRQ